MSSRSLSANFSRQRSRAKKSTTSNRASKKFSMSCISQPARSAAQRSFRRPTGARAPRAGAHPGSGHPASRRADEQSRQAGHRASDAIPERLSKNGHRHFPRCGLLEFIHARRFYLDVFTHKVEQYIGNYLDVVEDIKARLERERMKNARLAKRYPASQRSGKLLRAERRTHARCCAKDE